MSFLDSLASAFKGGGGPVRVPIARGFISPWAGLGATAFESGPPPFDYARSVRHAYLDNPVAQRSVRIVAEGVGSAPLSPTDPALDALVSATSAGPVAARDARRAAAAARQRLRPGDEGRGRQAGRAVRAAARTDERGGGQRRLAGGVRLQARPTAALTIPLEDEDGWPQPDPPEGLSPGRRSLRRGVPAAAEQAVAIHNAAVAVEPRAARERGAAFGRAGVRTGDGAVLSPDQFDRLKAELAGAYAGAGNAGRPMLLEGGLKWQSMAMTPGRHGLRHTEGRRGARHRARLRGAADAARAAGRQHLCQLPRGQPRAVAADAAAAGGQDPGRDRRGAVAVVRRMRSWRSTSTGCPPWRRTARGCGRRCPRADFLRPEEKRADAQHRRRRYDPRGHAGAPDRAGDIGRWRRW